MNKYPFNFQRYLTNIKQPHSLIHILENIKTNITFIIIITYSQFYIFTINMIMLICTVNTTMQQFSLNLYLQHVGGTPQGPEGEWGRTPALLQTVQAHRDLHTVLCFLCLPLGDSATKMHQAEAEFVVWKSENYQEWVKHQPSPSWVWQRIYFALAPWRWRKSPLESQAQLVTVHSMRPQPQPSSCETSSSALSSPASRVTNFYNNFCAIFYHLTVSHSSSMV